VREELERGMERTRDCGGLIFNIALNYGGRAEITDAVKRLAGDLLADGRDPGRIDERMLSSYLYTAGQPDPDLLIRTSGEMRVSNFLLWQIAYAEIWVTDVLWPDFRRKHLLQAIADYQKRERRYGGIHSA
jgi:undecaprenyl diphosphate synthase